MAIPVIMPRQGQSVETCIITKWFFQKGEKVNAGDILFSYETDKAAFDVESPSDGFLIEIYFGEGAEVPVLANVAVVGTPGEEILSSGPMKKQELDKTEEQTVAKQVRAEKDETAIKEAGAFQDSTLKIRISPRARRIAREKGVDYSNLTGSGPNGRILFSDIEKAASGAMPAGVAATGPGQEYSEQPLSGVRRLIAKAMYDSLQNSAQLTHHMSADVRRLLEARRIVRESIAEGTGVRDITLNDMICWCVIRALEKFPALNSHFLDDRIRSFKSVNLGIAVDTPRGLMVPVVKAAESMDLSQLSAELKSVAEASRKGNIDPDLLRSTSATFTVSNLGSYGVEMFTPVINLPQIAILGVCTIISRPADLGNNTFGFVPCMGLSLTYDHRAIDGGPATLFLKEIKEEIEKGVRLEEERREA